MEAATGRSIVFGVNNVIEGAQDCFWGIKEIVAKWQGDEAAAEEAKSTQSVNVLQEVTGHKLDRTLDVCEMLSGAGSLMKSLKGASAAEKLINALEKI